MGGDKNYLCELNGNGNHCLGHGYWNGNGNKFMEVGGTGNR